MIRNKHSRTKYTNDLISRITKLYVNDKLSARKIGQLVDLGEWSITRCLKKNGIKIRSKYAFSRKYLLDETYFECVNTEAKAYFLGFLYADGAMYSSKKGCMFHLTLHENDVNIIEKFQKELKTEIPIHSIKNKKQKGIFIWSKKIFHDLVRLGCGQKKSLTLEFPTYQQVPLHLMNHFLRGFFDGDGSVTFNKNNYRIVAKIISSLSFCKSYENFLINNLNIDKCYWDKIKYSKDSNLPYSSVGIGSFRNIDIFYKFIYLDATIFLNRKKMVFDRFFEYKNNKLKL